MHLPTRREATWDTKGWKDNLKPQNQWSNYRRIRTDYILLLVFWWSCTIFFWPLSQLRRFRNPKQIRNTNHQESTTVAILSRPPVTILRLLMWFLNTWADGLKKFFLSQGKKPRDEERRTPAGDNKKEALGFLSATKIGGRFLMEMWQETTSKSPQTPKLEEAKVRGKSDRLKSWNAVLFVFVFSFVGYCFFCVVYVCHLKKNHKLKFPKSFAILYRSELLGTQKEVMEVLSCLDCSRWKRGKTAEEIGGCKVTT